MDLFLSPFGNKSAILWSRVAIKSLRVILKGSSFSWFFWRFLSIVFDLERTHQLSLLPEKDLVNLCPPIEP
ncbi:MAG: hypothetical protein EWV41_20210 [Microcystis wesenbergii Mw_MB_S_20031200_S109]|nr:MAG: hypothetical protein EWV41_20210 [Microcystis wesenbergii Mw_MB_S_20031200_S109]